jgi:hypothetical protein
MPPGCRVRGSDRTHRSRHDQETLACNSCRRADDRRGPWPRPSTMLRRIRLRAWVIKPSRHRAPATRPRLAGRHPRTPRGCRARCRIRSARRPCRFHTRPQTRIADAAKSRRWKGRPPAAFFSAWASCAQQRRGGDLNQNSESLQRQGSRERCGTKRGERSCRDAGGPGVAGASTSRGTFR